MSPPADYVAPFSLPASMAIQKVKVPSSGHEGEPQATGLRATLVWGGESGPTCKDRAWSGQERVFLLPPPHGRAPHLLELPCLGCSQPSLSVDSLTRDSTCEGHAEAVGRPREPRPSAPQPDCPPGSTSFATFKDQPLLAAQPRTLNYSAVPVCLSQEDP